MIRSILSRLRPEKMATRPAAHHVSIEKIGAGIHIEPPIGRRVWAPVVPGNAAQVVDQVGAKRRMNPRERRQSRINLLLHQRGMEMTGIDDN